MVPITNLFIVSLDMTVMINVLQEIIEILHEKMLKAIDLYWICNDASEKTNTLNGHCNELGINE